MICHSADMWAQARAPGPAGRRRAAAGAADPAGRPCAPTSGELAAGDQLGGRIGDRGLGPAPGEILNERDQKDRIGLHQSGADGKGGKGAAQQQPVRTRAAPRRIGGTGAGRALSPGSDLRRLFILPPSSRCGGPGRPCRPGRAHRPLIRGRGSEIKRLAPIPDARQVDRDRRLLSLGRPRVDLADHVVEPVPGEPRDLGDLRRECRPIELV